MPKTEDRKQSIRYWMHTEDGGEGNLRKWNAVGSPIAPDLRSEHLKLTIDAGTGVGYMLNGAAHVPCREVSTPHAGDAGEHHVHREVDALKVAVDREGPLHPNARVLALVDASTTVESVRKGVSNSDIVQVKIDALWAACLRWGRVARRRKPGRRGRSTANPHLRCS